MDIAAAIERYAAGYAVLADALEGIGEAELDTPEAPGEWTPRQIVHHLADGETWVAMRIRRILAEDEPTFPGYDQARYFETLFPDRPIEAALGLFRYARETTTEVLRRLPAEAFERRGIHEVYGAMTIAAILDYYQGHANEHADQIRRARAASTQG